jgi:uncharacterized membrane protein YraQ (UPF0718 family)
MTDLEKQNLTRAITDTKLKLGLPDSPLLWTYEQRVSYNKELASVIAQNPTDFDTQTQQTANDVNTKVYSSLEDDSYLSQIGLFNDSFLSNLSNTLNKFGAFGKWLIIGAVILAVTYLFLPHIIKSFKK